MTIPAIASSRFACRAGLFLVLAALISPGAHAQEPPTHHLDLETSVRLTLANNRAVQISRIDPQIGVQEVRAALGAFDPELTGHYFVDRTDAELEPGRRAAIEDAESFLGIAGRLPWGTRYSAGVSNNDTYNPFHTSARTEEGLFLGDSVSSAVDITMTQPLLRGLGLADNYAGVRIAKRSKNISDEVFRAIVIETATDAIRAYHGLYLADQNLLIAERNRANAARLLRDNRRRAEIGTMAPLDVYQAESEVAFRDSRVIAAKRFRRQSETRLIALISDQPDDVLRFSLDVLPPDEVTKVDPDVRRDYALALKFRPDYRQIVVESEIRDLVVARERRRALPELNVIASMRRQGVSQTFGDSFQEIGNGANSYSIGAVFSVPLFNRDRGAARTISYLNRTQTEIAKRELEQRILIEMENAANQVEFAWQQVLSTQSARQLAVQSLEAEEKKLQAGSSETFFVLRLQGDLAAAELLEINALHDYRIALAEYDRACGLTLERRNIRFE